jgi:hypothetical protein
VDAPAFQPLKPGATTTTLDALYAAADDNHRMDGPSTSSVPAVPSAQRGHAVDLMPVVWRVRGAAGEVDRTWLRFDGLDVYVLRPKGQVDVAWRPQGNQFVAQVQGWSMSLGTQHAPTAPWLTNAVSFNRDGAGWMLRDAAGRVTARLVRKGTPPPSKQYYTGPPKVTTDFVRAHLADPEVGPGVHAVDPVKVVGRWVVPGFDPKVALTFDSDGQWNARTSCESGTGAGGGGGRFRLLRDGSLLVVAGAVAGVGCSEPKTTPPTDAKAVSNAYQAASVLLASDAMTLFDRAGKRLGTLHRAH